MILGADDLGLVVFFALVAMLVGAVIYAVSQFRKGFSMRKMLIAMAVCCVVLAVLNWIANSAVTRAPKESIEIYRHNHPQKN
jgi:hypothetical protein